MKTFLEQPTSTGIPDNVKEIFSAQDPESYENMYNVYFNSIVHLKELRKPDNKKAFLPLESVQFPLELLKEHFTPKPLPKPAKMVFEALKPAFLKDELRPTLSGMAVHSGYAYATDAHILVKYRTGEKQDYFVDKNGQKSQLKKDGDKFVSIHGTLPPYYHVIPDVSGISEFLNLDLRNIYPLYAVISDWAKTCFLNGRGKYVSSADWLNVILYHECNAYNLQLFTRLAECLIKLNEHTVKVYHTGEDRALTLIGKKSVSIIMPFWIKNDANKPYINL